MKVFYDATTRAVLGATADAERLSVQPSLATVPYIIVDEVEGNEEVCWKLRKNLGQSDYVVDTDGDLAEAGTLAKVSLVADADKVDYRDQYVAAVNRLEQIRDANNPTNAQVVAAVKDLALYQLKILRVLRKLIV